MKQLFLLGLYLLGLVGAAGAQSVAINNNGVPANSSSILDVSSTAKGFLLPRMTGAQRLAIPNPALGLQVFQTDNISGNAAGFYFFNGTAWVQLTGTAGNNSGWLLNGNGATNPATQFLGTVDAVDFKIATQAITRMTFKSTGEIGIGTNNPAGILALTRINANTSQPILRIDDNTSSSSPTMLLFNSGNNNLINASTLGSGTMMHLARSAGDAGAGEGLLIENQGSGAALHAIGVDGIGVFGASNRSTAGSFVSTTNTGVRAVGNTGVDILSIGDRDGLVFNMTGNKSSVLPIHGFNIQMTSTGTAPVIGVDVLTKSATDGVQVVGILSTPVGGANSSVTCFIGTGDMSISGQYFITSDRKLKKNIEPMNSMMDKIMQLSPSNYLYRSDEFNMNLPKTQQHGLIAQELQAVFPELVAQQTIPTRYDKSRNVTEEEVKYLGVNYMGLIPIIIKGMQEQEQKIDTLQRENEELKRDLAAIKAKLGL